MDSTERPNDHRVFLEDVGKLLGLVAVLLPATGFAVRYVFFNQFDVPTTDMAVRTPLAELAATGFWALFPAAFYPVCLVLLTGPVIQSEKLKVLSVDMDALGRTLDELRQRPQITQERLDAVRTQDRELDVRLAEVSAKQGRLQRKFAKLLPSLPAWLLRFWWGIILPFALFLPGWPVNWLYLGSSLLLTSMAVRVIRRTGRLALAQLWWVIAIVLLALAIASGLSNDPPGVYRQSITFLTPHGVLRNGPYYYSDSYPILHKW